MFKNIFLLILLTWVSLSYGKHPVVHESISDADAYKVDKPVAEQEAQRSVAGEKFKKKKPEVDDAVKKMPLSETDSEVRYWQYSE